MVPWGHLWALLMHLKFDITMYTFFIKFSTQWPLSYDIRLVFVCRENLYDFLWAYLWSLCWLPQGWAEHPVHGRGRDGVRGQEGVVRKPLQGDPQSGLCPLHTVCWWWVYHTRSLFMLNAESLYAWVWEVGKEYIVEWHSTALKMPIYIWSGFINILDV